MVTLRPIDPVPCVHVVKEEATDAMQDAFRRERNGLYVVV